MTDGGDVLHLLRSVVDGQKTMLMVFRTLATVQEETWAGLAVISDAQGTLLDLAGDLDTQTDATFRRLAEIEDRVERGFWRLHEQARHTRIRPTIGSS